MPLCKRYLTLKYKRISSPAWRLFAGCFDYLRNNWTLCHKSLITRVIILMHTANGTFATLDVM